MERECLVFETLDPIEIDVKIAGVDYVLREANGETEAKYTNTRVSMRKHGPDGSVVSLGPIGDLEPFLVSLCLFYKQTGEAVPESLVRSWPAHVQRKLHTEAKRISLIDEPLTAKELEEEISRLQKQLDLLRKKGGDGVKN